MGGQPQPSGPTAILNKCKEINDGIHDLRSKRESQLAAAQNALLDSSTGRDDQTSRQTLDYIEDEINIGFRYLRDLLKKVKQTPGSGDQRVQTQIDVTSKNLRREIEQYQRAQSDFQKRLREQVRRRYEIANPEASPEELDQGVENVLMGQEQSFQVRRKHPLVRVILTCPGCRKPNPTGQRGPTSRPGAVRSHSEDRAGHDGAGPAIPGDRGARSPARTRRGADQPGRRGCSGECVQRQQANGHGDR